MEDDLRQLTIDEEEDDLPIKSSRDIPIVSYNFCMVGMFFTYNPINFQNMQISLADLWHPLEGDVVVPDKLDEDIAVRINDDAKKMSRNTKHNIITCFPSSQQDASNNTPANVNLTDNSEAAHPVKGRIAESNDRSVLELPRTRQSSDN